MFRNWLLVSLLLHVLLIIGAGFTIANRPVPAAIPLCLELGEPVEVKESGSNISHGKARQPKTLKKQPDIVKAAEETPPATPADTEDSLKMTTAVETGADTPEQQASHIIERDNATETGSGLSVASENRSTGGVPEGRSPIYAPRPNYPIQARLNNWEGSVLLEVTVGPDGQVQQATVLQSSDYPILDRAAQKTLKRWRYQPFGEDGLAAIWLTRVRIKFVLEE
jgi:protein TonB